MQWSQREKRIESNSDFISFKLICNTPTLCYLLGGSSTVTVVTTLFRNTIPHTEEHVVKDSSVNADRGKDVHAPVGEMGKDPVSSSVGNRDFGLWRGHKVNSEFVYLLDLNDFTKISMTEVDSEMLVEYKDAFAYLQNKGFNARVDDANSKLQDVQTRRAEKLRAVEKAFGTMGTKLAFGFIGDDLLSSP
ncbi:hypothetical protein POM88_002621 [Heracleum sosnowskyi]|uniref:Uncharacterized protein n=1 Tax=Heracleum sosnowskyi TaxID=360622 RepID=A0AAD8JI03_9APIA|nr:hypothetical protein POM88_002621 [Heracleum sosnowskyi]